MTRSTTLTLVLLAGSVLLGGCQNSQMGSTALGGAAGCLGGAIIAVGTGGKPGVGCAIGAALGAPVATTSAARKTCSRPGRCRPTSSASLPT